MPWMKDDNGAFMTDASGNPVWLTDDGDEKAVDYEAFSGKHAKTVRENMQRKERIAALEKRYARLAAVDDLETWHDEASKALEFMKTTAGKDRGIEELVRARVETAVKSLNEKLAETSQSYSDMRDRWKRETVENAVNNIPLLNEPRFDMKASAKALFLQRVDIDDDGPFARDGSGQPAFNENGRASLAEAFAQFVREHPDGAKWMSGVRGAGSGALPGGPGAAGAAGSKRLSDCHTEAEKIALLKEHTM